MLVHLDRVPFVARPCRPGDAAALAALQGACACTAQRAPLSEQALLTAIAGGLDVPLAWAAQVPHSPPPPPLQQGGPQADGVKIFEIVMHMQSFVDLCSRGGRGRRLGLDLGDEGSCVQGSG